MKPITVTKYIADDGVDFDTQEACYKYEQAVSLINLANPQFNSNGGAYDAVDFIQTNWAAINKIMTEPAPLKRETSLAYEFDAVIENQQAIDDRIIELYRVGWKIKAIDDRIMELYRVGWKIKSIAELVNMTPNQVMNVINTPG